MTFPPDAQGFINRRRFALAFAAHVGGIEASVLTSDFSQFDQFLNLCVVSGRINERGRYAECALLHSFGDERFHFFEFFGSGDAIDITENSFPDLRGANIGADVEWRATFFQPRKVAVQRRPVYFQVIPV